MPFSYLTEKQARTRQQGKCGRCGGLMNHQTGFTFALLAEKSGGSHTEKNCVILCENCYRRLFDDRDFQGRIGIPPTYFPHAFPRTRMRSR